MSEYADLRVELGEVTVITIDRPTRRGALSVQTVREFERALDEAESVAARAIVLTGTGEGFCAGADLQMVAAAGTPVPFLTELYPLLLRLRRLEPLLVVAINGMAVGAGLELLLAADIAVASPSAKAKDGHLELSAIGGTVGPPRALPPAYAKYLVLTGVTMQATDLLERGLVAEIVEPAELLGRARMLALAAIGQS